MAAPIGPFDLNAIRSVLAPNGSVTPKAVSPNFYQELYTEFDGFGGHVLISQHSFDADWETWEVHPNGDEIVYLISGDTDFALSIDGKRSTVRVDKPGTYIVVPRGAWHKASPHKPTTMLFITTGEGTLNADQPE